MTSFAKTKDSSDFTKTEWFVLALTLTTIPFIGWWAALPIAVALGWIGDSQEKRKESLIGYPEPTSKEPDWWKPRTPEDGILGRPVKSWSWSRYGQSAEPVAEIEEIKEVKIKTLAITNHARRNLALRHGVITEYSHLDYEELTPFEEEGEGCFIALFPEINKSKEFAVFLDEDKKVIKTFMPHTDYKRNRAYFKKHTNLDNALKDDMTKDLDFLQKVWLDKLA